MYEKAFGADHPVVAASSYNLAELCKDRGEYEEAAFYYERTLNIDEKLFGKDHDEVATDLNNLAEFCEERGKYEEAERLYKEALVIRGKLFGKADVKVESILESLSKLYVKMRKEKAIHSEGHAKGSLSQTAGEGKNPERD